MTKRKKRSKTTKRANRFLAGLVVEGLGFGLCLWLLISVWTANGGGFHFLLGGVTEQTNPPTPISDNPNQDSMLSVSSTSFPIAESNPPSLSGWNRVRIRP